MDIFAFPKDLGIRTKIILSVIILLVFVALLFFWASYMHEKKGLLANMQDSAIALNRVLTISITNQKNIAKKVNLQTLVEELSLTEGIFGVWVIDKDCRITSATFREQVGEIASRRLVLEAMEKGYYVSGFDTEMGEEVYEGVYPIKRKNKIFALVRVAFELNDYFRVSHAARMKILDQMKADSRIMAESLSYTIKNMYDVNELIHLQKLVDRLIEGSNTISWIMIVDDNSRIIACSDTSKVGMIANDKGIREIINGANIYTRIFPRQKIYMVDMPLKFGDELKGVASVGCDATKYYAHLSEILHFILLISFMGIFLGIVLSFQLANPIIMPIRRLIEVTKRLSEGNLSQRATVNSKDEVGTLGKAFNQMAEDLSITKQKIDEYSKTLEEKVRLRTKQLEISNQELREMQNELIKADMAKSEFLSIASHELRTPLTTLLGYSELLLTRTLTESQKIEFLGFINEESVRLSNIVDDILDISRIESQRGIKFNKKPLNLAELLVKNIRFYSESDTGYRFIKDIKQDLPLVNADGEKIEQAIKNLLDNAIKYSTGGDIICKTFEKDNMVWISIQDHGMGIPEKDLPFIFDKFYRVNQKDRSHIGGTGLGLAIIKFIIKAHDGKIDLESEEGEGTTICFGLPVVQQNKV
jgi:signal transduction histidine kinase